MLNTNKYKHFQVRYNPRTCIFYLLIYDFIHCYSVSELMFTGLRYSSPGIIKIKNPALCVQGFD